LCGLPRLLSELSYQLDILGGGVAGAAVVLEIVVLIVFGFGIAVGRVATSCLWSCQLC
jgi:hypothetical protein